MAEYHFPIPGSVDEDKIVLFVKKHWASYLGQFILGFFLFILPIVLLVGFYGSDRQIFHGVVLNFLVLGLSIYYLIIANFIFVSWLSYYYDLFILSVDSIIEVNQQGFFGRKISQISLLRVQDVTSNISGIFATLFAYGNVLVETAGEKSQNFLLEGIPNPGEVAAKIMQLHNELVEKEGRHKELLEGEGVLKSSRIIQPPERSYRELLRKEKEGNRIVKAPQEIVQNAPVQESEPTSDVSQNFSKPESEKPQDEGEIDKNHLDMGGEIDFK